MTSNWDDLAAAARWARARANTLRDSHWIGGDPALGNIYGWASWSPERAIIALRNPSSRPQKFTLDLAAALELPKGAVRSWHVNTPRHVGKPVLWTADRPNVMDLKAFEVQVWDLSAH